MLGYVVAEVCLNPTQFRVPLNWQGAHTVAIRKQGLELTTAQWQTSIDNFISTLVHAFASQPILDRDSFLLATSSKHFAECQAPPINMRGGDWVEAHDGWFRKQGICRPSESTLEEFGKHMPCPGFKNLTWREREVAYFWSVKNAGQDESYVDLSMSIEKSTSSTSVQWNSQSSRIWLARAQRILTGREIMALHGVSEKVEMVAESDLSELASAVAWTGCTAMVALAAALAKFPY